MELAQRFSTTAHRKDLRILALKGISIADELYGGIENRPMADVDFLVVDPKDFEAAVAVVRSLGLVEIDAGDHALAFQDPCSGVMLELHIALTSCPGLFAIDPGDLWARRRTVLGTSLFRLDNEDLIVHLALHAVFQHGLAPDAAHYRDFTEALLQWELSAERVMARACDWNAASAIGAMAEAALHRSGHDADLPHQIAILRSACPRSLSRWIRSRSGSKQAHGLLSLSFVRYQVAPSKRKFLVRTLRPRRLPGRTLPTRSLWERLTAWAHAVTGSPEPEGTTAP